jgi:hypothetical protein
LARIRFARSLDWAASPEKQAGGAQLEPIRYVEMAALSIPLSNWN